MPKKRISSEVEQRFFDCRISNLLFDKKDMRSKKIVKVPSNKVTQKRISNLKGKQKYYIQIRSYKNMNYNGEMYTIFSNWTKSKAVTTKG